MIALAFLFVMLGSIQCMPPGTNDTDTEFIMIEFRCVLDSKGVLAKLDSKLINDAAVHKFKVYGQSRYFFLFKNDDSDKLVDQVLPGPPDTQRSIPVSHFKTYLTKSLKVADNFWFMDPVIRDLSQEDKISIIETVVDMKDLNITSKYQLKLWLQAYAQEVMAKYQDKLLSGDLQMFVPSATLPLKIFFIIKGDDQEASDLVLTLSEKLGGPKDHTVGALRVRSIPLL